jgi:hypothetical protein
MDEQKMPWSGEYPESQFRPLNALQGAAEELGGPSQAQYRQFRDRVSLFIMGNQCSGPSSYLLFFLWCILS